MTTNKPTWNKAAWKQNTYRADKPRTMHAPVGPDWPGRAEMLAKAQAAHTARQDAEDAARGPRKPAGAGNRSAPQPLILDESADWMQETMRQATANPRGWETADTSTDSILTVADVAKLPVGTRVVVEEDRHVTLPLTAGTPLVLTGSDQLCAAFVVTYDDGQTLPFGATLVNRLITFRLSEPAKPALLTLAEAKAAVDAGKTVRCVEDAIDGYCEGMLWRKDAGGVFVRQTRPSAMWFESTFADYSNFRTQGMRFEVVEK